MPHSEIHGSKLIRSSPWLIAAYHVLHRLCVPRHPPDALLSLDHSHRQWSLDRRAFTPITHGVIVCTGRGSKIRRTSVLRAPFRRRRLIGGSSGKPLGLAKWRLRSPNERGAIVDAVSFPGGTSAPPRRNLRSPVRAPLTRKGCAIPDASCSSTLHASSMPTSTEPAKDQLLETDPDDVRSGNIDRDKHRPFQRSRRNILSNAAPRTPG